jgi:copper chaperone CopZ
MTTTRLLISGMRDNCCREKIAEVLTALGGVKEVDVSLFRAAASVVHDRRCTAHKIIEAICHAGFGATEAEVEGKSR